MPMAPLRGRGLSLWWLPPTALADRLQGVIDSLAARLESPPFPPHVTVEGGLSGHTEELAATLAAHASARLGPELVQIGVGTESAWNRLLYLDLARSPAVDQARVEACTALGRTVTPSTFRPHLSLAYGQLDPETRQQLAAALRLALPPFHPVALALVDTRGQVEDWWVVQRWPLAAAPSP